MAKADAVHVILNPGARGERAAEQEELIAGWVPRDAITVATTPREATSAARACAERGVARVVAAGGDGTVNAVANGLVGSQSALGVLPCGTVNVFALELGLPGRLDRAWEIARASAARSVDVGKILFADGREHVFVQFAGIGLDAQVVRETSFETKRLLGPFSYVLAGVRLLAESAPEVPIRTDLGEEVRGTIVLVGNGAYYGGRFRMFPNARNDDGWLDACVFTGTSALDLIRYIQGVLLGLHPTLTDVVFLRGRRFDLTAVEAPLEADGDLLGSTPATIEIMPGSLRVIAPSSRGAGG